MAELTTDQVRERLLRAVWGAVDFWDREARADKSKRERLEGLALTVLSLLDGGQADLPQFIVAPNPCDEDQAFHEGQGEDWFPSNDETVQADLGGSLHELFYSFDPKRKS